MIGRRGRFITLAAAGFFYLTSRSSPSRRFATLFLRTICSTPSLPAGCFWALLLRRLPGRGVLRPAVARHGRRAGRANCLLITTLWTAFKFIMVPLGARLAVVFRPDSSRGVRAHLGLVHRHRRHGRGGRVALRQTDVRVWGIGDVNRKSIGGTVTGFVGVSGLLPVDRRATACGRRGWRWRSCSPSRTRCWNSSRRAGPTTSSMATANALICWASARSCCNHQYNSVHVGFGHSCRRRPRWARLGAGPSSCSAGRPHDPSAQLRHARAARRINEIVVALPRDLAASPPAFLESRRKRPCASLMAARGGRIRSRSVRTSSTRRHHRHSRRRAPIRDGRFVHARHRGRQETRRSRPSAERHREGSHDGTARRAVPCAATIDRESIYLAQTPQAFTRKVLAEAIALKAETAARPTKRRLRNRPDTVRSLTASRANIKITTAQDLRVSEALAGEARSPEPGSPQ